ncbi:MAG: putative bifunctional diguanylate cyclase/phosphodiesterase [Pseudomonadota bacterium]
MSEHRSREEIFGTPQAIEQRTEAAFGAWLWDIPSNTVSWSGGMYAMFGLDQGQGVDRIEDWRGLILEPDRPLVREALDRALQTFGPYGVDYRIRRASDGAIRLLSARGQVVADAEGRPLRMFGSTRDITEIELDRHVRGESLRLLGTLMAASPDVMIIKDAESRWKVMNPAAEALYGLSGKPWSGRTDLELIEHAHPACEASLRACVASDEAAWRGGGEVRAIESVVSPDGEARVFDVIKVPLFDDEGRRSYLVVLGRDITERAEAEARLERAARHDALTGLVNRAHFLDHLDDALAELAGGMGGARELALVYIDLDHFKPINDSYGHHVGDRLLQQVTARFRALLGAGDVLARLGGDEFVVLLEGAVRAAAAEDVARGLIRALAEPFEVDTLNLFITGSIGISHAPGDACDAATLMMYADSAMYRAKELGRNTHAVFRADMSSSSGERMALLGDLRRALESGGLELHYQPQLSASVYTVESVEALVRWRHPVLGMLPPDRFIGLAEDGGLIYALGGWVVREACRQLMEWRVRLGMPVRGAVNVSPLQLQHPDFVTQVTSALHETGLPAESLEIEITESALLRDPERAMAALVELRRLGIQVALDDFGTGYSSLSYLKRFPFDRLKIDRTFVRDILSDPGDLAIVRAIIAMGHSLGLHVVAEGVEQMEQRMRLEALGCDLLQGYLIGRPAPAAQVETMFGHSYL